LRKTASETQFALRMQDERPLKRALPETGKYRERSKENE